MVITVTGGAGFIGTNLLLELKNRYPYAKLNSIDNREPSHPIENINYINCDILNKKLLFENLSNTNKIFHLAAKIGTHESFENIEEVFQTNIIGTTNILEFVRNNLECELFIAGMPGIWDNPYSISKDAAIRSAKAYYDNYNIKVSVLRWFSVYGPYQYIHRYQKAVPTFINCALENKPLEIYGDGNQVADFIYVNDAIFYAIQMLENKQWGQTIECGTGIGISVNELAKLIIKLCNSKSEIVHIPMRKGEPLNAHVIADISKLSAFSNYNLTSLEEGLNKTILYYSTNR